MAYLRTLEGTTARQTGGDLENLFNCNDTIGVMLFGADAWNKIKLYAANRALELLAAKSDFASNLSKIAGQKIYRPTNDILERAFGFNHCLGVELYGVEEWRDFVLDVKTYTPPEYAAELCGVGDAIKNMLKPAGLLYPETMSPGGIAQWLLAAGLTNTADALYSLGAKSATDKALEARAEAADARAVQTQQEAAAAIEAAKQIYNTEYARAKAQEDATATANANLQYQLKTNPEYMAQQHRNYVILGGCALLAAVLLVRKK